MVEGGVDSEEGVEVRGKRAREIEGKGERAGDVGTREEVVEGGGEEVLRRDRGEGHLEEGLEGREGFKGVEGVGVVGVDLHGCGTRGGKGPVEAGEMFGAVVGHIRFG